MGEEGPEFCLREGVLWGTPPPQDPELLEAPKAPKKPKLTCAKGASVHRTGGVGCADR